MKPTIHVQGHADRKDVVHFFITRGGLPEIQFTRAEFRALVKILDKEHYFLSRVEPGSDISAEVCSKKAR